MLHNAPRCAETGHPSHAFRNISTYCRFFPATWEIARCVGPFRVSMNDDFDLVSAMLALALCAVMLVAGQQYLLARPDTIEATSARLQHAARSGPSI
jgi:hypothetical protein